MYWRCCLLVPLLFAGCSGDDGPGYVPVSGVVIFNGNPIEGAVVTFTPNAGSGNTGQISMGITDENGEFSLRTGTGKKGAAIGTHKVSVELMVPPEDPEPSTDDGLSAMLPNEMQAAPKEKPKEKALFLLPRKFADPLTSGLTATVESGGLSDHKIELSSR